MSENAQLHALFPDGLAGIVFDCDGVMIDSEAANRRFYNIILDHLGLPHMTPEQERYAFMATAIQALRNVVPEKYHERIADIIKEAVDYDKDVLPHIKLMPGFRQFLNQAKDAGLALAVDTNRTDFGIERVLDFFDLQTYFEPVITSSKMPPKPSPDGVLAIAGAWNVKPECLLFIGDSEDDMQAAKGAGAVFAAFGEKGQTGDIPAPDYATLGRQLWPFLKTSR